MRTQYLMILVVVVIIATGCSARRRGESPDYSSYWHGQEPAGIEREQHAADPIIESSMLERINPFHENFAGRFPKPKLTCQDCQQKSDVLLDGQCMTCMKQHIDGQVIGYNNLNGTIQNTEPDNVLASIPQPPSTGDTTRRQFMLPSPGIASESRLPNTKLVGKVFNLDEFQAADHELPDQIEQDGGDFLPQEAKLETENTKEQEFMAEVDQTPELVTGKLPKKPDSKSVAIDSIQENGETKPDSKSNDVDDSTSSDDTEKQLVSDESRELNPKFETFRLQELFSDAAPNDQEPNQSKPKPMRDEIDWGMPIIVPPNSGNPKPPKESNDEWEIDDPEENEKSLEPATRDGDAGGFSNRTEQDIIRELQNSTVPNRVVFDNTPPIPQQQPRVPAILLTAKPVPHYQELRQIAKDIEQPASLDTPTEFIRDLPDITPAKVQAIPVSSRKSVDMEHRFDFRPLPDLTRPSDFQLAPVDPNLMIEEVFEPDYFPMESPQSEAYQSEAYQSDSTANVIDGELDEMLDLRSPFVESPPNSQNSSNEILLHAVPSWSQRQVNSPVRLEAGSSQAKFKFVQPKYQRERFED